MVAVAAIFSRARDHSAGWLAAGLVVLVTGTLLRLAVRPVDAAAVSAALVAALLWLGVWAFAVLLLSPRGAFLAGLLAMVVLDVAALPARTVVLYDDWRALYRTDQVVPITFPGDSGHVVVLVDAVFDGARPTFALDGFSCQLQHGRQYLALPAPVHAESIQLRLTGAPDREREYLVVYTSARDEQLAASPATICQ